MSGTEVTDASPGARESTPHRAAGPAVSPRRQLLTLTRAMLRGFLRDRTALFFTFFFPLMFLIVFGLIFNNASSSKTTIGIVGGGAIVKSLPQTVVDPKAYPDADAALAAVRSGDIPAVVVEQGDTVTLRYAASDQVKAATVQGLVRAVVDAANVEATGQPPRFTLTAEQVEDTSLKPIQYLTPGILSWGIATSAAFGAALTLVSWRRKQLLRRVRLSPAPVWTVVGARVGVSLLVAGVQAVVFVGLAMTPPFGLRLAGQWWPAILLLIAGTLAFLSIGLFVGAVARTEEAASAIANFIVLPMAFLSGTFFDISAAPGWLQAVSQIFPLRWMNQGMLDVLVRGKTAEAVLVPTGVLLVFAVVVSALAARLFRWDDA
jgi:ABC-2 type transport system permease protein